MQLDLESPALTMTVPVGGFEVKTKHVLPQPAGKIPKNKNASRRDVQTRTGCAQLFSASVSAIRHLRTGAGQGESYFTAMDAEKTQQILYALMNGELRVILDGGDRDLWGLADLGSPVVVWPLPQAYKMVSTT